MTNTLIVQYSISTYVTAMLDISRVPIIIKYHTIHSPHM